MGGGSNHKGDVLHGCGHFESDWIIGRFGSIRVRFLAPAISGESNIARTSRIEQLGLPLATIWDWTDQAVGV